MNLALRSKRKTKSAKDYNIGKSAKKGLNKPKNTDEGLKRKVKTGYL